MNNSINQELLSFLQKCPTAFHAVASIRKMLTDAGYEMLEEHKPWTLRAGGRYAVTRNGSALIAFRIPEGEAAGFQIVASHSDSPAFKVKENPEMQVENQYVKLNVERYGGLLCAPWFDRPLSVAGRAIVEENGVLRTRLVNLDRDLVLIPNLAIHMNREVNDGYKYNPQKDMLPLYGMCENSRGLLALVAEQLGTSPQSIKATDLFLYNRMEGTLWGENECFVSAPHLDDLQCSFASLKGFLAAGPSRSVPVFCLMDNEEVGSGTKQGAASTFLKDTLHRVNRGLGRDEDGYLTALAASFMISADNAHAVHPNHADKTDPTTRPYLNGGIVIKHSANQKYTTDAVSAAVMRKLCEKAGVPWQNFLNRSDILGGSTLGNISGNQVALNTVDIGLPQLAMHSPYETAGAKDTAYLAEVSKVFYGCTLCMDDEGGITLE